MHAIYLQSSPQPVSPILALFSLKGTLRCNDLGSLLKITWLVRIKPRSKQWLVWLQSMCSYPWFHVSTCASEIETCLCLRSKETIFVRCLFSTLTQTRVVWEWENASIRLAYEQVCRGIFWLILIWEGSAHCGWYHLWEGAPGYITKQTEQAIGPS